MNSYNAFILTLPKLSQLDPEVKISYVILTPQLDILHFMFAFHIYTHLDKIYHYIKIILMISWVIIMRLFWNYQILSQLKVKISYNILTDSPQIINDKVLFVAHICLIRSIDISTSWINSFLSSSSAFNFCTTKNYPNLTRGSKYHIRGSKYRMLFWPPHSNNQLQSFICLSYLLEKMYYYIKIILMLYWVFMMLLFSTTNTWFHKVINHFISCKLKQDTSHHLILFW